MSKIDELKRVYIDELCASDGNVSAAIAAVAEWLDPNARPEIYGHDYTASEIVAATLLKQLEQPK